MKTELLKLSPARFCKITGACQEGAAFAKKYKTMKSVWNNCKRVDWLVWILNAIDAPQDEKACRLYMVWCARNTPLADGRTTHALLTDERSRNALVVAERFANGNATREELNAARDAAEAAVWDAARSAVWAAAEAAAEAAVWDAAEAAAEAAVWDAAEAAAEAAVWDAARSAVWAAVWDAQAEEFKRVVANPFA